MITLFVELADRLLGDENGISEDSYMKLLDLGRSIPGGNGYTIDLLQSSVEAVDGRFFLPEDFSLENEIRAGG